MIVELLADCEAFQRFGTDSDLGPWIERARELHSDALVLFLLGGPTLGVYFDGYVPSGLALIDHKAGEPPTPRQVRAAYEPLDAMVVPDGREQLKLTSIFLSADDGTPVSGHMIGSAGRRPPAPVEEYASRQERAWALYQEGPHKAPSVIAILEEEIAENPDNREAARLLAITCMGAYRFERALEVFDIAIAQKPEAILPHLLFYKAKTLHLLGRPKEALDLLNLYWAFFEAELPKEYPVLVEQVAAALRQQEAAPDK